MNLAAVVELVCLVGFVVILWGGKARREAGWRVMGGLMGVVAGLQVASVVVVVSPMVFFPLVALLFGREQTAAENWEGDRWWLTQGI